MYRRLVVSLVLVSACGPDPPAEVGACPLTAPERLVPAPDGTVPAEDAWYGLAVFGDDILFTFDRFDDPERVYWRLDRCTGVVEEYEALAPGLHNPYVVDAPGGRVLYANDAAGRPLIVDRMDEPGTDPRRPVPGLPENVIYFSSVPDERPTARFYENWTSEGGLYEAAGVGAATFAVYTHAGDPEVPAVKVSDRLIRAVAIDDHHDLILEDSGELHRVDLITGARELVKDGVRYFSVADTSRRLLWQAIGDDVAEPVYLHDVDAGTDIEVTVNDFAATSWGRDSDFRFAGEWKLSFDRSAAALIGPDHRWVAAVVFATGEVVAAPEHLEQNYPFAGYFRVLLAADEGEEVEALWDPRTGAVRTWYHGPAGKQRLVTADDTHADYLVQNGDDFGHHTFWRVDFTTGESVRLLDDVTWSPRRLDADSYLAPTLHEILEIPPNGEPGYLVRSLQDLALVDVIRGETTPLARRVSGYEFLGDEGIVFLDMFGQEPGLWVWPLRLETSRASIRELQGVSPTAPRDLAFR